MGNITNIKNFYSRSPIWKPRKHATPVLDGYVGAVANQSYPGSVWKEGSNYYAIAASGGHLYAWTGTSPTAFTQSNKFMPLGGAGTWDEVYIPTAFIRKIGGVYHAYYTGDNSSSGTGESQTFKLGLATSNSPITGYTKSLSNPIFNIASANTLFGFKMDNVIVTDMVFEGGVYYWFCAASDNSTRWAIYVATSTSHLGPITPMAVLFYGNDIDYKNNVLQLPSVFRTAWGWVMQYTIGMSVNTHQERNLRTAYCVGDIPNNFTLVDEDILNVGRRFTWDEMRVYGANWFKPIDDGAYKTLQQISGESILYYSGHDISGTNTGKTGAAFYTEIPDVRQGRTPKAITWASGNPIANIPNGLAWCKAGENCFRNKDGKVYQIANRYNNRSPLVSFYGQFPTYVAADAAYNNKPVMTFDGVNNFMSFGKGFGNPSSFSVFIVCDTSNVSFRNFLFGSIDAGGATDKMLHLLGVRTEVTGGFDCFITDGAGNFTNNRSSAQVFFANTPLIVGATYQNGDNFCTLYKNGIAIGTVSVSSAALSTGTHFNNVSLGRGGNWNSRYWPGRIAEIVMHSRVVTADERDDINGQLITEYGIV